MLKRTGFARFLVFLSFYGKCRELFSVIRYDTIEQFDVNTNAECDQLNLARVARKIFI